MKVLKFLMERNSINALHGQVTVGILILQVCLLSLSFVCKMHLCTCI
jgi:predicted Kef-type K+ transport protein